MSSKDHPVHKVAKKTGQLHRSLDTVLRKLGQSPRQTRDWRSLVNSVLRLERLATAELAAYKNTGSVSRSGMTQMQGNMRTIDDESMLLMYELKVSRAPQQVARSEEACRGSEQAAGEGVGQRSDAHEGEHQSKARDP